MGPETGGRMLNQIQNGSDASSKGQLEFKSKNGNKRWGDCGSAGDDQSVEDDQSLENVQSEEDNQINTDVNVDELVKSKDKALVVVDLVNNVEALAVTIFFLTMEKRKQF